MLRRRAACLLPMLMVALTCATRPTPALASGTTNYAYYELTNTRPSAVNDAVTFNVVPPNSIAPPDPTTSPLTILDGSFGFDQKNLQVFLSPTDPSSQGLAIQFGNGGLEAGGKLDFKVSLDPSVSASTVPQLQLQAPDTDLTLVSIAAPTTTTTTAVATTPTPLANTPEPVSLALWSALAGAGLIRARAFRRARRASIA